MIDFSTMVEEATCISKGDFHEYLAQQDYSTRIFGQGLEAPEAVEFRSAAKADESAAKSQESLSLVRDDVSRAQAIRTMLHDIMKRSRPVHRRSVAEESISSNKSTKNSRRRLLSQDASMHLLDHEAAICGIEDGVQPSNNSAKYGDCVASEYRSLAVVGMPSADSRAYAGEAFSVEVYKRDIYNQTMLSDSESGLTAFTSLNGARKSDPSVNLLGQVFAEMKAGKAFFSFAVTPSFSNYVLSEGSTTLFRQPLLYFQGADAIGGLRMESTISPVEFFSGSEVCRPGEILLLQPEGAMGRSGSCSMCRAGTYSFNPLAYPPSSQSNDPSCLQCPTGGDCTLGGDGIVFPLGVWVKDAQQTYWELHSCGQGHKVINKAADGMTFDHDAQTCELCGKGEECQDNSCIVCTLCAAGKYKGAVGQQACEPCPVNTYNELMGATKLDDCIQCAEGSNTGSDNGQTSKDDCVCDVRFYKSGTTCTECPPGAFCPDGTCALSSAPPGKCSGDAPTPAQDYWLNWPFIPGNWTQADSGKFELMSCPSGFQKSSATAGAEQCIKCLETQYIIDPNADQCEKCPKGLRCQGDGHVSKEVQNSTWQAEGGAIQCSDRVCKGDGAYHKVYVLKTCPTGYARISEQDDWPNQMCDPCNKGEECTKDVCEICEECKPGTYKTSVGTDACLPCPANTYRENPGATELSFCIACPFNAETGGLTAATSLAACSCNSRFYSTQLQPFSCSNCPKGAVCPNFDCALGIPQLDYGQVKCGDGEKREDKIKGTWERKADGTFALLGCPVGHR